MANFFSANDKVIVLAGRQNLHIFPVPPNEPAMGYLPLSVCEHLPQPARSVVSSLSIVCCDVSHNGRWLAAADSAKNAYLFEFDFPGRTWIFYSSWPMEKRIVKVCFDFKDCFLVLTDKNGDVWFTFLSMKTAAHPQKAMGHTSYVMDLLLTMDGDRIISCDRDEKIRVSKFPFADEIVTFLLGHREAVVNISLVNNDRHLVSASVEGVVKLWKLEPYLEIGSWNIFEVLMIPRPTNAEVLRMKASSTGGRCYVSLVVSGFEEIPVFEIKVSDRKIHLYGKAYMHSDLTDMVWFKEHLYIYNPEIPVIKKYTVKGRLGLVAASDFNINLLDVSGVDLKAYAAYNKPFYPAKKRVPSEVLNTVAEAKIRIMHHYGVMADEDELPVLPTEIPNPSDLLEKKRHEKLVKLSQQAGHSKYHKKKDTTKKSPNPAGPSHPHPATHAKKPVKVHTSTGPSEPHPGAPENKTGKVDGTKAAGPPQLQSGTAAKKSIKVDGTKAAIPPQPQSGSEAKKSTKVDGTKAAGPPQPQSGGPANKSVNVNSTKAADPSAPQSEAEAKKAIKIDSTKAADPSEPQSGPPAKKSVNDDSTKAAAGPSEPLPEPPVKKAIKVDDPTATGPSQQSGQKVKKTVKFNTTGTTDSSQPKPGAHAKTSPNRPAAGPSKPKPGAHAKTTPSHPAVGPSRVKSEAQLGKSRGIHDMKEMFYAPPVTRSKSNAAHRSPVNIHKTPKAVHNQLHSVFPKTKPYKPVYEIHNVKALPQVTAHVPGSTTRNPLKPQHSPSVALPPGIMRPNKREEPKQAKEILVEIMSKMVKEEKEEAPELPRDTQTATTSAEKTKEKEKEAAKKRPSSTTLTEAPQSSRSRKSPKPK